MPTYEQLYNLNLGNLNEAVQQWADIPARFKGLLSSFSDDVEKPFNAAEWTGPMMTVQMARMRLSMCHKGYADAAVESKGIHGVLEDVHSELKKAKEDLHNLAEVKAPSQGLYITSTGTVLSRNSGDPIESPSGELGKASEEESKIGALYGEIKAVLDRAAQADEIACWALRKDIGGKNAEAFNGKKVATSLDSADALHAAQLMRHGSRMTHEQLYELREIMHRNRNDPEFSTAFYKDLGPKKTVETIAKMTAQLADNDDRQQLYKGLKKEMGLSLATATDPDNKPHLGDTWNEGLRKAGSQKFDPPWENEHLPYYGYQALGEILKEGNYDPHFLVPVAEHVTQLQVKHPGEIPNTGILEALGHSPQASTDFFNGPMHAYNEDGTPKDGDPDLGKGSNGKPIHNYLDYLTSPTYEWGQESHPEAPGTIWGDWDEYDKATEESLKKGPNALGHALEAAVSGQPYDDDSTKPIKHSGQEASLMNKIVDKFGNHPELLDPKSKNSQLSQISDSLGHMTADYMGDFQQSLSAHGDLPSYGAPANLDADSARTFLSKVGQNPEAYASIGAAQRAYTAVQVDQAMNAHTDSTVSKEQRVANAVHPGATIAGIMSQARVEAVHDSHTAEDKEFNDRVDKAGRTVNRVVMIATGSLPGNVAGNAIGFGAGEVTQEILANLKHDSASTAQHDAGQKYTNGMEAAQDSARSAIERAAQRGHFNQSTVTDLKNAASDSAMDGHTSGAQWEDSRHG
ncbi:hypothetical protein ACWCO0_23100 [Streptomyces tubercidicus]